MEPTLQINFHGLAHSDAAEALVRERMIELAREGRPLTRCRVTIEAPHRHHRKGNRFDIHLELHGMGGHRIVHRKSSHEDAFAAIRDVFDAARRGLQVRRGRGADAGHGSKQQRLMP
ncbi:MAG: HPF/RaiA family ribosome-associated protein [Myxococcales bacterium]